MDCLWFILYGVILLVSVFYIFIKKTYSYWRNMGIPGPKPSFPGGNIPFSFERKTDLFDVVNQIYKEYKSVSPFAGMYTLTKPSAVITDLNLAKNILIKDFNSFPDRGLYYNERDDPLTGHLFLLDGAKWKTLRNKLSPTFTSGKMKFMFPTIVEVGHHFTSTLQNIIANEGELMEMRELLARFTTDIIGTCAFGIDCNSLKDPNAEFRKYGRQIFERNFSSISRSFRFSYIELSRFLRLTNNDKELESFFMNVVKETVDYREKNNIRRNDFLDLLIQLKNTGRLEDSGGEKFIGKLSLEETAAQAFVFFIAGFETSSTTMSYFLHEISVHQDIQDRLREEINEVLTRHNGNLTYEAMSEMTYLELVLSETLRKYPPVALLFRRATENYKVPNTKYVIEKGVRIIIPCYAIHHDPEVYSDPEKFDPERFTTEEVRSRHSTSFLAFGDGPRNCIGLRFGKMQARIGIIMLLKNFKFEKSSKTPEPLEMKFANLILAPKDGMWLHVKKL